MSKKIKIITPRIYEHSDFFHDAVDFAREHSLNTNELCLELSHYLVDNFEKIWKVEKPRVYKKIADLEAKLAESQNAACKNIAELTKIATEKDKQIEELKQQLAESEAYIQGNIPKLIEADKMMSKQLTQANQDKISFAVEKLSDVRSFISDATEIKEPDYTKVCNYVDNQIEELKKEMK